MKRETLIQLFRNRLESEYLEYVPSDRELRELDFIGEGDTPVTNWMSRVSPEVKEAWAHIGDEARLLVYLMAVERVVVSNLCCQQIA